MNFRLAVLAGALLGGALASPAAELVTLDPSGVIRWTADGREVALFGANYNLPSSCDYRAAGYVHADRKKLVDADMTHFARMGWDAMRFSFWGDWENCDRAGNLIVNDHLDVMDYAIAQARKRGIFILLTPITTYAAWFPDGKPSDPYPGFSKVYSRAELGTNPAAIAAQCNYLRQLLDHVNPYTGVALKDEPAILFIELINEPWDHPEDFAGSVAYIDALAQAVRDTGCRKILFYNLSQDFRMTAAIKTSRAQGVTFAWYPTGLSFGHELSGNYLRTVDHFGPMLRADIRRLPKIVYEFESPDVNSGYMYPAMVRAFREVGAQFATMFSYDMLATAPYNLGWQTHFLNLVYTPKKAVSAVIAAEAMRTLPRYGNYGDYPENRHFGPFAVSYERDAGEMATDEALLYDHGTTTAPPHPERLRRIVGVGSSPVVDYEGDGAYFLDRLAPGVWRLEVYPDAVIVQDPFAQRLNYRTVSSRLVWHEWPMTVRLPDLGNGFTVTPLNQGNRRRATAAAGRFIVSPGVYLLSHGEAPDPARLPQRVGRIGLREFVCPAAPALPAQILPRVRGVYPAGRPLTLGADVVDGRLPAAVAIHLRTMGRGDFQSVALARVRGYRYAATVVLPAADNSRLEYFFTAATAEGGTVRFPAKDGWLTARLVGPDEPLTLFDATRDIPWLSYTRIGDTIRHGIARAVPATATGPAALRLMFPLSLDPALDDYTASLVIKDRIGDRSARVAAARALKITVRGSTPGQKLFFTLVEADGTSWSAAVTLSTGWQEVRVPLDELRIAQGVMLPLGYPGRWNYWLPPAHGRGGPGDRPRLAALERLQFSFRPEPGAKPERAGGDAFADIASVRLVFE